MSCLYKVNPVILNQIIDDLKNEHYLPRQAKFIHDAINPCKNHIYYDDFGFLNSLGHYRVKEIINDIAAYLLSKNILKQYDIGENNNAFGMFSYKVKNSFVVPWKSFTPTMEYLVYFLCKIKNAKKVLVLGANCGYTLAWLLGPIWKIPHTSDTYQYYAVDKNSVLIDLARKNIKQINMEPYVEFAVESVSNILDRFDDNYFDLILLDTRKDNTILNKLHSKLKNDGWLLMHNASDPHFSEEIIPFINFVHDPQYFRESILFPIDSKGLELSIK